MNVNRASVTGALKILSKKKLINYKPYGYVTLKNSGKKIAKEIAQKHKILEDFFINVLLLDKETASNAACKMEHSKNKDFIDRFMTFINFINSDKKYIEKI